MRRSGAHGRPGGRSDNGTVQDDKPDDPRHWLAPLAAVLVAQIAVSFLSRLASTLAPALSARTGWSITDIGLLSSLIAIGSAVFMLVGLPLILRAGPVRSLQAGLLVGALGAMLYAVPVAAGAVVGSLLIGLASGPQASAGSDVLKRYAPARIHNLVFSIKQAGVPLGGVLAGLLMPILADGLGLVATFLVCGALGIAALLAMQPLQRRLDAGRDRQQATHLRLLVSLDNLRRPLRALAADANLRRIALAGACLALGQSAWFIFLVTLLVAYRGMTLAAAGALFALMQVVSVFGRPLLGMLADRMDANRILQLACIASAVTTLALAFLNPQWPSWAVTVLVVAAGCTVSSWNGVQMAQMAHFARPGAVAESATGASLLIFLANMAGPVLFGVIAALGGDFRVGFGICAVCTVAALLPLSRLPRSART